MILKILKILKMLNPYIENTNLENIDPTPGLYEYSKLKTKYKNAGTHIYQYAALRSTYAGSWEWFTRTSSGRLRPQRSLPPAYQRLSSPSGEGTGPTTKPGDYRSNRPDVGRETGWGWRGFSVELRVLGHSQQYEKKYHIVVYTYLTGAYRIRDLLRYS